MNKHSTKEDAIRAKKHTKTFNIIDHERSVNKNTESCHIIFVMKFMTNKQKATLVTEDDCW